MKSFWLQQLILAIKNCYDWGIKNNITVFRGSENDVLNRYYRASEEVNADIVIRITADDPFKEPFIIDKAVQKLFKGGGRFCLQ